MSDSPESVVGHSVPRCDARDKVTGGEEYPINFQLPKMLHGAILRSSRPHARVVELDTTAAKKVTGVEAVLTPSDVPDKRHSNVLFVPADSPTLVRDMVALTDHPRYVGEPVAAVAASTTEAAREAVEAIDVQYEKLPSVTDPVEAQREDAPQLYEDVERNVALNPIYEFGDVEEGFERADHIFEGAYETQRITTGYMEPKVCVSRARKDGRLDVWSNTQELFGLQEHLAYALDIPESRVRVHRFPYIGGGFGGKLEMNEHELLSALLSQETGRPVRIEFTRHEDFTASCMPGVQMDLKVGIKDDGTFTALSAETLMDAGAHTSHAAVEIIVHGMFGWLLPYRCPHARWEGKAVLTNKFPVGAMRGYGCPQGAFPRESLLDDICEELGLDRLELRQMNAHEEGDDHPFVDGFQLDSYRFEECIERGAREFGWSDNRSKGSSLPDHVKRGRGMATQGLWVSGCMGFPDILEQSGAIVKLNADGTADVSIGTVDLGGGQSTVLLQIVAEELGVSYESVRLTEADTLTAPVEAASHASRVTYSSGNAVQVAAREAKQNLKRVAATMLEVDPTDLEVRQDEVRVKGAPQRTLSVQEVAKRAKSSFVQMTEEGPQPTTVDEKGSIMGTSSLAPPSNPSPAAAIFVEVEVNTLTGQVDVTRAVYAHDLGRLINPDAAEGQVEGGFQEALGWTLMEQLIFDEETGSCLNPDFLNYKMATAEEMPEAIESIFVESQEPTGPFGAKSLGEMPMILPAPAIANAVQDAVGVRFQSLPITPEKVLEALGTLD